MSSLEGLGGPLGEDALVQVHGNCVVVEDYAVKEALHVAVRAEGFFDVATSTKARNQLYRLEPHHVLGIGEHEADYGRSLVYFEGHAGEGDAFENDSGGIQVDD